MKDLNLDEFPKIPFQHKWEPDFSEGEPPLDSKICGICGREDDLYHNV